jgi:hypothetical protein
MKLHTHERWMKLQQKIGIFLKIVHKSKKAASQRIEATFFGSSRISSKKCFREECRKLFCKHRGLRVCVHKLLDDFSAILPGFFLSSC